MYHHFFHNSINDTSATVVIADEALTGDQLAQHGLQKGWGYWGVFDFDLEWALAEAKTFGFRGTVENLKIINA